MSIMEQTVAFFDKLQKMPCWPKVAFDQVIQFKFTDASTPFWVKMNGPEVEIKEGDWPAENPGYDLFYVTIIEITPQALEDIFDGRLSPVQAWFQDKLWITGVGAARPRGPWTMSLLKMGQVKEYPDKLFVREKVWV